WHMVQGTELKAFGVHLHATSPVDAELDTATGELRIAARWGAATVHVAGGATGTLACPAGESTSVMLTGVDGKALAARVAAVVGRALQAPTDAAGALGKGAGAAGDLGIVWQAQLDGGITGLLTTDDGQVLAGSSTGEIVRFDKAGRRLWEFKANAAVYAFATGTIGGAPTVFAGSDDEHLYALAPDGTLRWKAKAKVSQWMAHHHSYWTMANKALVRKILVTDIDADGKTDVFLGTGGSAVERFDEAGRSLWLATFHYGTPSSLLAVDAMPKRPGLELVAGAYNSSYDSTVRILAPDTGKVLRVLAERYPSNTPDLLKHRPNSFSQGNAFLHAVSLPNDVSGVLRTLCGPNWNQICMNNIKDGKALWCRDVGPGGSRAKLAEYIPGAALCDLDDDGTAEIVAGFGNGWVTALSATDGQQLWATRLPRPVCSFSSTTAKGAFLAGCDDGTWMQLNARGTVGHQRAIAGKPSLCASLGNGTRADPTWIATNHAGRVLALQAGVPDARWSYGVPKLPLELHCQAAGRDREPLKSVAGGNSTFIGAAWPPAKAWTLSLPTGARVSLLRDRTALVEHTEGTALLHSLVEAPWKVINGNQLRVESDVKMPFAVAIQAGPLPDGYASRVLPQGERWKTVRTNGAEFVVYQNEAIYFKPKTVGQWFEVDRAVPTAGEYELWAEFYCSDHRGTCDVLLNGKVIRSGLDLFRPKRVFWTAPIRLGSATLDEGTHKIRFSLSGKRPEAKDHVLSVRSVVLIPANRDMRPDCRVDSGPHGLGLTWRQGANTFRAFFPKEGNGVVSWDGLATDAEACSIMTDREGPVYYQIN
ncbi:MAG: PQQ-like beta-propeller repeat protein, partial [Victivallales bacterium]|nr:PQQ-like beta-propeller repeat protein [Victivallales bacterium]